MFYIFFSGTIDIYRLSIYNVCRTSTYGGEIMFDKKLMSSSTDMMILKLLENEDMYGYQMIEGPKVCLI